MMRKINVFLFFFKDDPNSSSPNTRSGQTGGKNVCFDVCISKLPTFELTFEHTFLLSRWCKEAVGPG